MNTTKNTVLAVLFFGALWGFTEATLGYLLHLLPWPVSGLILYPIGVALMLMARRATGSRGAIFCVALVAAAIKLVDFFIPGAAALPERILNPSVAIVLEGLTAFVIVATMEPVMHRKSFQPVAAVMLSFSWRVLYLGVALIVPWPGIFGRGPGALRSFLLFDGLVSSLLLWLALFHHQRLLATTPAVEEKRVQKTIVWATTKWAPKWALALGVVACAVAAEVLLTRFG